MQINKITQELSVSPQISLEDINTLKDLGFKTIICNRPDNESADQIDTQSIRETAEACGISFISHPVVSGAVTDDQVLEFKKLTAKAEKPILAYCRTGTRCSILWALSSTDNFDTNTILSKTKTAGYELGHLQERLQNIKLST